MLGPGSFLFLFFCSFFSIFCCFLGFFLVLCRVLDLLGVVLDGCVASVGGNPTWPHCLDCDSFGSVEAWLGGAI